MHTAPRQVHVRVPATTANLGSGFDILGLALQLYNVFSMRITAEPGWRVSLPPGARFPTDDRNLVFRAARVLFTHVGYLAGLHLSHHAYPPGTWPGQQCFGNCGWPDGCEPAHREPRR